MTTAPPTNKHWFRKLIHGQPHQIIGGNDDPYLLRWYLIPRNPVLNIYLHQFLRSDDDRALHDRPWWFWSMVLLGHYYEHRADGRRIKRHAGSIAYRRAETRHRVELPTSNDPFSLLSREDSCVTLVITGPRVRVWGFWCKDRFGETRSRQYEVERFVPYYDWHDGGCGEPIDHGRVRADD
ncbi:hypothetical protein [Mycobacteroides abscessus]|uniref:Uncharacterized protein n=1 Tax=Mycobacteroides abscessus subsp. massiliense TaxID=1962118 RepID=A0A1U0ZRE9_9MYCO|nr:hypothetical protein [Mycobacteroides abscessus]SKM28902.1 Uncharacterised protein [Mycobacteroides abscessus subsp. massiliense]SKT32077.1 Uncharacterised protein [Mycobacteroides abscessus subsp. massiliense]SKT69185.1 Uncharacterised protein [Mycobacteroides abscessus subsp. massiliense]SKX08750.1 Uncharacterised protein [Mycobacteroides abscessus subsp. massiliense]